MVLHHAQTAGYVIKILKTTLYKLQNSICYLFMGWGVTLRKQSLIRYPKIIGNPIECIVKCFLFTMSIVFCNQMTSSISLIHLDTFYECYMRYFSLNALF